MDYITQVPPSVRELDADGCWRLLASNDVGRLAVRGGESVDVFPVNYLVHERAIYFRSAPGTKVLDAALSPEVAFEIDGQFAHHVWSVVVHGTARRVWSDTEVEDSGVNLLKTWYPSDKLAYVRITPTTVTGRNFFKPES